MPAARMVQTVVHRADSVRSEQSDASQANKRVSFNRDVDVKHKGKKSSSSSAAAAAAAGQNSRQGLVDINGEELGSRIPAPVYAVYKEPTSLTEAELALEAERIIKQVDQISCTVSPNPAVFGTAGGGVPGGPVSVYETRSLERRPKRNNNSTPQQQQQQQQQQQHQQHQFQHQQQHQQHPGETSWTRTLPGGSSTKNQLLDRNSVAAVKTSNRNVVEKNSNIIQQQQRQQRQLIVEQQQQQVTQNRESTTTPPKYDSGIEMEGGGGGYRGDIPGKRPNVNLIVQQLTEEARQRELMRQQYQQQQQEEEEMAARNKDDPLAPRLPVLNLIEPDPQFGLTHNRNLPFSYTGGVSPTRLSPLRSSGMRFPSPPKTEPQDETDASGVDPGLKDDIVYAQVKVAHRKQSKSPDPFQYPTATSGGVKLHLKPTERRPSNDYYADDDDQRDDEDDQDIEARKAKARFLFGTRIEEDVARRKQEQGQQERFRPSVRIDQRNNNRNNSRPTGTGLSYNYSSLIKGKQEPQQPNSYTTKVSVNSESSERKQQRILHQYNDDDDFARRRLSAGGYKDRSMSPEPRINIQPTQQSVATRIRSLEMRSSPERYRDEIIQTLPQIKKAHHHQQQQQQQMTSTRLIQEAERGRTSSRRYKAPAPSRPVQVQSRHESIGPPKPPIRVKKLSRERMDAATSTSPKGKKKFQKIVPWQPDAGSESSPERTTAFNNSSPSRRFTSYRYPSHQRSVSPSPERIRYYNNKNNINNNNVNNQQTMTLGRPINKKTTPTVESTQDGKQEKMHRQRSKFLSVFLGPKTSRSSNKTANASVQTTTTSAVSSRKQPAISKWEDDVDLSAIKKTPKVQQTRLTFQHQQPPSDPSGKYRRGSIDRTDTSESDDVHHHRFKSLKQKSQSFNNLNYRPDPERVLGEEEPRQRHDWNANNTMVDNRRPADINNANNNATATVVTGGRYYHSDARPYASTNLINQIGRTTVEIGGVGGDRNDIIIDEGGINRPNPLDHNNPRVSEARRPMMAKPARQMRYFGDTDLESQQSVTNGHISHRPSVRYIPKVNKVAQRSVSNAAGMGAVRRGVMQRNNTGSGGGSGEKTQLHSVNSSESEGNGSAMQSGASAESQRSVYLHATTVADIPTIASVPNSAKAQQMQSARRRALSREDMSALSGSDRAGSTLRRTRQISRSYSVLAPWKPRHYRDKFEITYSNQQAPAGPAVNHHDVGKPPRAPPVVSSRRREDVILESEDSADVYRPVHITSPNTKPSVTRSSTMPKSNKLMAGWFRKKKQR